MTRYYATGLANPATRRTMAGQLAAIAPHVSAADLEMLPAQMQALSGGPYQAVTLLEVLRYRVCAGQSLEVALAAVRARGGGMMAGRLWTEAEEDLLRDLWGAVSDAQIAGQLRRGPKAVATRAALLRLSRKDAFLTASAVGRICGVDAKTVAFWIGRGVLSGRKAAFTIGRYQPWHVDVADFEQFLRAHPGWYRVERITEEPWAAIVRQAMAADPVLTVDEAAALVGCSHETIVRQCRRGQIAAERIANSGNHGTWMIRRSALAEFRLRRPSRVSLGSIADRWRRRGPLKRRSTAPLGSVPVLIDRSAPVTVKRARVRYQPVAWRAS